RGLKECRTGRAELYRCRARLRLQRGEADGALGDFQLAIDKADGPSAELARDHFERGRLLYQGRRGADAVKAYRAALEVWPACADAHLGCARALLATEDYAEVRHCLDEYLRRVEKGKEPAEAFRLRGLARAWDRDLPGAVEDYNRALVLQR